MTSVQQAQQQHDIDEALKVVAKTYRDNGFSFHAPPRSSQLPPSLGPYIPPAVAFKDDKKVVIELRLSQDAAPNPRLADIRNKLAGQQGWRLDVIYAPRSTESALVIEAASKHAVRDQLAEVSALAENGHARQAFTLAWSLLEAAFNSRDLSQEANAIQTPSQLVQSLAMDGHIDAATDLRLRGLVPLFLRITHGDLKAVPSAADLHAVVGAIEQTLSEPAS